MRFLLIILFLLAVSVPSQSGEKRCDDCPPDKPCEYTVPMGCNTGYGRAYCVADRWYGGITRVTTAYCGPPQISNPFENDGLIPSNLYNAYHVTGKFTNYSSMTGVVKC